MAKLHPVTIAACLLALATVALLAIACSGSENEADVSNPGSTAAPGLSVTLYASPT